MKEKSREMAAGTSGLLAAALVLLVRFVDVAAIGPEGTSVGMAHLNQFVFRLFGVHMRWYHITDWLGIIAILTALLFAVAGLAQWIRRKSLLKVDGEILALGGLYLLLIGLYALFETAIVNYRPILMPDASRPEASFPSSHTMMVCVILGSAAMLTDTYVRGALLRKTLRMLCAAVMGVTVIGRLIAGVHWFTDILGGVLISVALLSLFSEGLERLKRSQNHRSWSRQA